MNTDLQIVRDFQKQFDFLKQEKIILYGTGQYTKLVIEYAQDGWIVGLMDQKKTGERYYGYPVLSEDEIASSACKNLIIISNLSVAPQIYERIKPFVEKHGIQVYYMNGEKPKEYDETILDDPYWKKSRQELLETAMQYDVISFDLFDTLIMRKCVEPEAVFEIVALKAKADGYRLNDFVRIRKQAEKDLYHSGKRFYSIDDIYEYIREQYRLDERLAEQLKSFERKTELEMSIPRPDVADVFRQLLANGKNVIICSDMYLDVTTLKQLLDHCNIPAVPLLVSWEQKASKYIGNLFEKIKEQYPGEKILHIGDNRLCDIEHAKAAGLDAYDIAGASVLANLYKLDALLRKGSVRDTDDANTNDANRIISQLFVQKCFQDSFPHERFSDAAFSYEKANEKENGKIRIQTGQQMGYLFFGPLAMGYMIWLIQKIDEIGIGHILFVSRDGYLFEQIYRKLSAMLPSKKLPKASYFLTSRRCSGVAAVFTEEDVRFVLEYMCNRAQQTVEYILNDAFGVEADKSDEKRYATLAEIGKKEAFEHIQQFYMEKILAHAKQERENYWKYIDSLGLEHDSKIGMMNFVGRGVTQQCMQKVLGREMVGFYFAAEYEIDEILSDGIYMTYYPDKMSTHTARQNLYIQYLQGEAMFSAPYGQLKGFNGSGEPFYVHTDERRVEVMKECQEGILEYINDYIYMNPEWEKQQPDIAFIDAIYGLLTDKRFVLDDRVKKGMVFEDG